MNTPGIRLEYNGNTQGICLEPKRRAIEFAQNHKEHPRNLRQIKLTPMEFTMEPHRIFVDAALESSITVALAAAMAREMDF